MDAKEHKERHAYLHRCLDELVADYIGHTNNLPSETSVMQLMNWSYTQTIKPTPGTGDSHD